VTERALVVVGDTALDQSEIVAAGFLAGYQQCSRPIRAWLTWCNERGVRALEVKRGYIELWARELEEVRGNKPATVAHKIGVVCGFEGAR
jgi:integrase/recombinase XerD